MGLEIGARRRRGAGDMGGVDIRHGVGVTLPITLTKLNVIGKRRTAVPDPKLDAAARYVLVIAQFLYLMKILSVQI